MALLEFIAGPGQWRLDLLDALKLDVSIGQRAFLLEENRQYWARRDARSTTTVRTARATSRQKQRDFCATLTAPLRRFYAKEQQLLAELKELVGSETIDNLGRDELNVVLTTVEQRAHFELDEEDKCTQREARAERKAAKAAALSASAPDPAKAGAVALGASAPDPAKAGAAALSASAPDPLAADSSTAGHKRRASRGSAGAAEAVTKRGRGGLRGAPPRRRRADTDTGTDSESESETEAVTCVSSGNAHPASAALPTTSSQPQAEAASGGGKPARRGGLQQQHSRGQGRGSSAARSNAGTASGNGSMRVSGSASQAGPTARAGRPRR